jgi:futalosine hydrolase
MKTFVLAATQKELDQIDISMPKHEKHVLDVGAFHLGQKLEELLYANKDEVDLVILVGIAGCTTNYKLGTHVLITDDTWGDQGVITEQSFETLEDMGLRQQVIKEGMDCNIEWRFKNNEPKAKSITVNTIYKNKELNQLRLQKHKAEIENMEGAAFHYLCEKYQIPYLHIRGLSNYIGERDKSQWKIEEAIQSYSDYLNKKLIEWN